LQAFVATELALPVSQPALAMSDAVRNRHGEAALAVLFYGSCLRRPETQLVDSLLDFYVLVDDYRAAYDKAWLAYANQILPPNVFYIEIKYGDATLRAKYAVISLRQFAHGTSSAANTVSLWARFCQPVRLTWSRSPADTTAVTAACSEAVLTMLIEAQSPQATAAQSPQATEGQSPQAAMPANLDAQQALDLWIAGFRMTYGAELRPESSDRAAHIVATDADRYVAITSLGLAVLAQRDRSKATPSRRQRRLVGKLLNIARLIKGAFTFEGGLDYILWKIARHSGVTLAVTDWQRRHPLLAAPGLAWRLYRRGAFR
jgi:hypothetical protein